MPGGPVAVVLKGYPRLSETFIAQELLGLQRRGLTFRIVALRRPTDRATHPVHDAISVCCGLRPPVDISCAAPSTVKEIALN